MPLIDTRCKTCGHVHQQMRPLAMHPATPPCLDCGAETEQIHLPKSVSWNAEPVVVYQAKDGSMRFPGDRHGLSASNYEKQGFKRIEIRGAVEMRRFESHMNKHEYSRAQRAVERRQEMRERSASQRSADIRHGLQQGFQIPETDQKGRRTGRMVTVRLSERGRDVMRQAVATGENRPRLRASDPGFYSEVFSMDRSNRDESRDNQGRRRRD